MKIEQLKQLKALQKAAGEELTEKAKQGMRKVV